MPLTVTIISWTGFIVCLVGAIMMAHKDKRSWIVWLVANGIWLFYGAITKQWALVSTEVMFVAVNLYGIAKWK